MSAADKYKREVGRLLTESFSGEFSFYKSSLELRRKSNNGNDVIVLSGSNKYSPYISLSFYFGKNYASVKQLEKALGINQMLYHVQQYSPNTPAMAGLKYSGPYTWDIDLTNPPHNVIHQLHNAVVGIAFPFFERFASMTEARATIAGNDSWCFGGDIFWRQLLSIDATLNGLDHFRQWSSHLEPFTAGQASSALAAVEGLLAARPNNSFKPKPLRGSA